MRHEEMSVDQAAFLESIIAESKNLSVVQGVDPIGLERLKQEQVRTRDMGRDSDLKATFSNYFLWALAAQLLVMNLVFVAVGVGCIEYEPSHLHLYMAGTLAEVFGVIFVITRYLFVRCH